MGRTATIAKDDVARARTVLRAADLPHGIIAIRNRLGRGSPQLIARFLHELDTPAPSDAPALLPDPVAVAVGRVWQTLREDISQDINRTEQRLSEVLCSIAQRDAHVEQLRADVVALDRRASAAEERYARLSSQMEVLQREVKAQYDILAAGDDQMRGRALPASPAKRLAASLPGASQAPTKPTTTAASEQLDLYRATDDAD